MDDQVSELKKANKELMLKLQIVTNTLRDMLETDDTCTGCLGICIEGRATQAEWALKRIGAIN